MLFLLSKLLYLYKNLNRPALFAGLSFFILAYIPVSSQNIPAYNNIKDLLVYQPVNLLDIPDSSQISATYNYDPLLSEKQRSSQDNYNSLINSNNMQLFCLLTTSQFKYYLACSYSDQFIAYRDDYQKYSFQNERREWDPSTGILYTRGRFSSGFGIGRHLPSDMHREHLTEVTDDPLQYVTHGPWQFSCAAKVRFRHSDVHLSLFSGPVHSSLSKVITKDGNSYRSFPITLLQRNVELGVNNNAQNFFLKTAFSISCFENIDLLSITNSMPQDIEFSDYGVIHDGVWKSPLSDSLFWKLSANITGGWMASYNFDRSRFTFFKADSILSKKFSAQVGLRLPCKINTGISGVFSTMSCPKGFLNLSAFSAWSVFNPLDYRFSDAKVNYLESGIFFNRQFSRPQFNWTPNITLSYIKTRMSLNYAHKEILVLLPVYVKGESLEVFDSQILLLTPSLDITVHAGKIDVIASVLQRIPLFSNSAYSKKADNPDDEAKKSATFTGGTSLSVNAIWNITRGGR